jgi:LPXTG-site transpeptidase (sortase) family protein
MDPHLDPLSAPVTDPLSSAETDVPADPLASLEIPDPVESVAEVLASVPAPIASATPRSRVMSSVRFAFYYCLVSMAVFVVLQAAANFMAYSEFVLNIIDPSRYDASSEHITHQIAQAQVALSGSDTEASSTGSVARAKILERRFETASLDDRALGVLSAIRDPNPYSPAAIKTSEAVSLDIDIVPYENRIVIPKINKNIPLVDIDPRSGTDTTNLENIFMKELERGVVRYPGTAEPGHKGNAFIFGHSSNYPWMPGEYNQVFAMLDKLSFGDEIIVYYRQKKYVYVVKEKKIVKPGNVKSLERDENKTELSLMTCWPLGTSLNRLLVFAELEQDPADLATAATADQAHTE